MTRALILAAGQGTRLRPLTNDKPKCLVPLMGKSLLERQLTTLRALGVSDLMVATGYRADQIEALNLSTAHNPEFETTNMVESLFSARSFLEKEGDLIIAYGDIIYEEKNLQTLLDCKDEIALMIDLEWRKLWSLRLENPLDDAETLLLDENGYVTELGKKPDSYERIQGQYTGLIKIRADKLSDFIGFYDSLDRNGIFDGKNFKNMYMTSFLQLLIDAGWKAKAATVKNAWLEVDSVEDLAHYEGMAQKGELDEYCKLDS